MRTITPSPTTGCAATRARNGVRGLPWASAWGFFYTAHDSAFSAARSCFASLSAATASCVSVRLRNAVSATAAQVWCVSFVSMALSLFFCLGAVIPNGSELFGGVVNA